jgi:hypothetical protein
MCLPVNSIGYPAVEARDALKTMGYFKRSVNDSKNNECILSYS